MQTEKGVWEYHRQKKQVAQHHLYIYYDATILWLVHIWRHVRLYVYKKGSEKIYKPLLVVTQRVWFWGEEGAFWITLIVLLYYLKFF